MESRDVHQVEENLKLLNKPAAARLCRCCARRRSMGGSHVAEIRDVIGVMGNVISFGLFLSPIPTFIQIIRKRAVEQYSPVPYIATLLNCMLWVLYGLPFVTPNSLLVITINGAGLGIEAIYLAIFLTFSPNKLRAKVFGYIAMVFVFVGAVAAIVMLTTHTHKRRSLIVGSLCVVFGTIMYAAPLSVMKLVIQTKCVKYMPFLLSLAGFLNGVCWLVYALLQFDIFITIPNGLGTLLAIVQLTIYAIYRNHPSNLNPPCPPSGGDNAAASASAAAAAAAAAATTNTNTSAGDMDLPLKHSDEV